jgi:hypothetical protein
MLNENDLKWSTTLCKELDEGIDINKELNILDQSRVKQLFDQHRLRKLGIIYVKKCYPVPVVRDSVSKYPWTNVQYEAWSPAMVKKASSHILFI